LRTDSGAPHRPGWIDDLLAEAGREHVAAAANAGPLRTTLHPLPGGQAPIGAAFRPSVIIGGLLAATRH
ncbi:MAG: hypothetical protein K2X74_06430, partial [Acetobacteraceae bacterium]|nr:hypothetical protein [Acetobacteraceae bacterium]